MKKIEVTNPFIGLCFMQVCAEADATDVEILAVCNTENPSGTRNGWGEVVRICTEENGYQENMLPGTCNEHPERKHFLVCC